MRTYEEFKEALAENMQQRLGEAVEITIHTVLKNNTSEEQISIWFPEDKISPSVNLEELYADYQKEEDLAPVLERLEFYLHHFPHEFEMPMLTKAEARENLFYQMISEEKNEELLKACLHRHVPDTDLVLVLRWKCGEDSSFLVKHGVAEQVGISEAELLRMAEENLAAEKYSFRPLREIFAGMMGLDPEDLPKQEPEIYVLTNKTGQFGAGMLLANGMLQRIREELGMAYFILPSSTHEVLIFPDNGELEKEELAQMVREVNQTEVAPQDVLSDHVYRYDEAEGLHKVI